MTTGMIFESQRKAMQQSIIIHIDGLVNIAELPQKISHLWITLV